MKFQNKVPGSRFAGIRVGKGSNAAKEGDLFERDLNMGGQKQRRKSSNKLRASDLIRWA